MKWNSKLWERSQKTHSLSVQDILDLGFVEQKYYRKVQDDYFKLMFFKQKEGTKGTVMWFNPETKLVKIWDYTDIYECMMFSNWNMMSFRGYIQNKEELKVLLKQLTVEI